jgi:hypothetical protein
MHRPRSSETISARHQVGRFLKEILKNFKIFEKSKNAGNCPKSAQNQKIFEKCHIKIFQQFSKNFGFVRFSYNFQHVLIFRKF